MLCPIDQLVCRIFPGPGTKAPRTKQHVTRAVKVSERLAIFLIEGFCLRGPQLWLLHIGQDCSVLLQEITEVHQLGEDAPSRGKGGLYSGT